MKRQVKNDSRGLFVIYGGDRYRPEYYSGTPYSLYGYGCSSIVSGEFVDISTRGDRQIIVTHGEKKLVWTAEYFLDYNLIKRKIECQTLPSAL